MELVSVCLALGADVNTVDCVGQTPLFYAVSHVQADQIVPLLLKAGQCCCCIAAGTNITSKVVVRYEAINRSRSASQRYFQIEYSRTLLGERE